MFSCLGYNLNLDDIMIACRYVLLACGGSNEKQIKIRIISFGTNFNIVLQF